MCGRQISDIIDNIGSYGLRVQLLCVVRTGIGVCLTGFFLKGVYMDAIIIAVASGKGGTGKSVASVFMGAALAALKKKVVLIELAPGLRSVDIMAGVSEQAVFDIEDVLSGRTAPARAVVDSPLKAGLSVVPAPYLSGGITTKSLQTLCSRMRPYFDFIILDVSAGYGGVFDAAARSAHRMILVETPDLVALRDGRALVDYVARLRLNMRLVLNRVDARQIFASGVLRDLDEAIDIVGIQLLGVIPESPAIVKAASMGVGLPPLGRDAKVFDAIARRILGEDLPLLVQ